MSKKVGGYYTMKIKQRIIGAIMTMVLTGSNLLSLGNAVIAAAPELEKQNSKTGHNNVEFNSYLEGNVHEKIYPITEGGKMYIELSVKENGYLKNAVVEITNSNYELNRNQIDTQHIQKIEEEKIYLGQINSNQKVNIELPVSFKREEQVEKNILDKISEINFSGTYIDGNGNEKRVQKTIYNQIKWEANPEIDVNGEMSKYIPYQKGEEYGVLVQIKINASVLENSVPVSQTSLEITLPSINDQKPQRVSVVANTTKASNGQEDGISFSKNNYQYDVETAKLIVNVKNEEDAQGKISWKQGKDEYLVTYVYTGKELYDKVQEQLEKAKSTKVTKEEQEAGKQNENAITGNITLKASMSLANDELITKELNMPYLVEEKIGNITDFGFASQETISKGYLYANYAKQEAKKEIKDGENETTYEIGYRVQIYDIALCKEITFETNNETLVAKKEVAVQNNIITKQIKIQQAIFQKMLGQDGKIEILDKEENVLGQIDSNSLKDEQGNYYINIEEHKTNEIIVKTSNPITEGNIEVRIQKAFVKDISYEAKQMQEFTKMAVGARLKTDTDARDLSREITLEEPVTKAQISIAKESLSTVITNKDVDINVVLDTSTIQNALYKNPVIEIQMPEQIKKVEIKDVSIILDEELKIKDQKVINQNGKQIIQITLEGTQTNYYSNNTEEQKNVIAKGANIIIKTDLTLDPLAPSAKEKVQMYYTNENTDLYENTYEIKQARTVTKIGEAETDLNIVAPTGLVTANSMTGFDEENTELMNIEKTKKEQTIKTGGSQKTVTVKGIVTNNYNNSLENVFILGRVPVKGNKAIDDTADLGNTFTMAMTKKLETSGIDSSKIKIYYSTSENANKNLIDSTNGWTETPSNLAEVKSYLIAITGEIAANTQLTFNYEVNMPANLGYNNSTYTIYKVYYDNKTPGATIGETETAGMIGITTGAGPELEVKLTSNVEQNAVVRDKQYVRFFVNVKNNGTSVANGVKVTIDGNKEPQTIESDRGTVQIGGTDYYIVEFDEYRNSYEKVEGNKLELELGDIGIGETKQTQYEVQIKYNKHPLEDTAKIEVKNEVEVSCTNNDQKTKSNTYILEAKATQILLINKVNALESLYYHPSTPIDYEITLTNLSGEEKEQVQVEIPLPQGVEVTKADINITDGTTTEGVQILANKVLVTLAKLERAETKKINVIFKIGANTPDFSTKVQAKVGEEIHYSNERYVHMSQAKLEGTQLAVDKEYIKEEEKFCYTFHITAGGKGDITNFVLEDTLADEIFYLPETEQGENGIQITVLEGEANFDKYITAMGNIVEVRIPLLPANTKLQIKIYARGKLLNGEEEKEVTNTAKIYAEGIAEVELNSVKHTIERIPSTTPIDPDNPNKPEEPDIPGTYKITGTAWIDENRNGQREESESILADMKVMLVHKENNEIVLDTQTGQEKIVTTDAQGKYEFNNLGKGEYLVIFLYDAAKYSITEYQKEGISQSYNSDAINMKIILEGKQTYAGVTDAIKIENENIRNIDIGLYVAEKFDLKLDKYISKISLTTPTIGTKVTDYNNTKLTKVEILNKNVNKSSIIVEYKIVVTNEGQIPGYARKIVDYLPTDAKFNTEINKDWYLSDNNQNVYNSSLAGTVLNPGESKEITLILSFNITDKNMSSIINNNAEIYESYNEQGIEDMDSTPANKVADEDDMSKADILLSVVTGAMLALYITLAVAILAIIIVSIILIQKKVIKKK